MAKVASVQPWWERLGHHFSGASGIVLADYLPDPPSTPGTQRSPGSAKVLAPLAPNPARRLGSARSNRSAGGSRSPRRAADVQAASQPTARDSATVQACAEERPRPPTVQLPELCQPSSAKPPRSREASTPKSPASPPKSPSLGLRHPLEIMSVNKQTEASIELATLPDCNVIVRYHLDDAMRRHKRLADTSQLKHRDDLSHLKEKQAAWRRKHDALVRRKRSQAAKFRLEKGIGKSSQSKIPTVLEEARDIPNPIGVTSAPEASGNPLSPFGAEGRYTLTTPSMRASSRASSFQSSGSEEDDMGKCLSEKMLQKRSGSKDDILAGRRKTSTSSRKGDADDMRNWSQENMSRRPAGSRKADSRRTSVGSQKGGTSSQEASRRSSSKQAVMKEGDLALAGALAPKKDDLAFETCVHLARKHNLRVDDVRKKWHQFRSFDTNGDSVLSIQEFEKVVRAMCKLPDDRPIPDHLTNRMYNEGDANGDGKICFEEYLLWSNSVQYSEEMMVPDLEERMLREIARQNGLHVVDVERIKAIFEKCDFDVMECIEEAQFKKVYCELMSLKPQDVSDSRLKRNWRQVLGSNGGKVAFKDIAVWWYFNCEDSR